MTPVALVDLSGFNQALRVLGRGMPDVQRKLVNQWALDIVRNFFNALPPPIGRIDSQRAKIKAYLSAQLSQRVKIAVAGKRKGYFIKKGRTAKQLRRVNLIVQARQARLGRKGLYGAAMSRFAGAFQRRAVNSVGYLKVVLLPIIRTLNPMVKYKMPFSETGGTNKISIWPGSGGYGRVTPATGAKNIAAWLRMAWNLRGNHTAYASARINNAWRVAVGVKQIKVLHQMEKELQKQFNKVSARPRAV